MIPAKLLALLKLRAILLSLAVSLSGAPADASTREAATDLVAELHRVGLAREDVARALWAWAYHESRWTVDALGDHGHACGVGQTHVEYLPREHAISCEEARSSFRFGFRAAVFFLRSGLARCGNLELALGAYSSNGQCSKVYLVPGRCIGAGLTERCELARDRDAPEPRARGGA